MNIHFDKREQSQSNPLCQSIGTFKQDNLIQHNRIQFQKNVSNENPVICSQKTFDVQKENKRERILKQFGGVSQSQDSTIKIPIPKIVISNSNETEMIKLKHLDFSARGLKSIPEEINLAKNVESLNLSSNELVTLPSWISTLSNLRVLKLGRNELFCLPNQFVELNKLEDLDLSFNHLDPFPIEICSLVNLKVLDIRNNYFISLSNKLHLLKNLQMLTLEWCSYTSPPLENTQKSSQFFECLGSNCYQLFQKSTYQDLDFISFILLFSQNGKVNQIWRSDYHGRNIFHQSALSQQIGVLKACAIEEKVNSKRKLINDLDTELHTPLSLAILKGNNLSINTLIHFGADPLIGGGIYGSCLHIAVSQLEVNLTKFILESGGDVSYKDSQGNTPLHVSFLSFDRNPEKSMEISSLLIQHGSNCNSINFQGWSPLHLAVNKKQIEVIKWVLSNPQLKYKFSWNHLGSPQKLSLLHLAAFLRDDSMIQALSEQVNPFLRSKGNKVAKDVCHDNLLISKLLKKQEMINLRRTIHTKQSNQMQSFINLRECPSAIEKKKTIKGAQDQVEYLVKDTYKVGEFTQVFQQLCLQIREEVKQKEYDIKDSCQEDGESLLFQEDSIENINSILPEKNAIESSFEIIQDTIPSAEQINQMSIQENISSQYTLESDSSAIKYAMKIISDSKVALTWKLSLLEYLKQSQIMKVQVLRDLILNGISSTILSNPSLQPALTSSLLQFFLNDDIISPMQNIPIIKQLMKDCNPITSKDSFDTICSIVLLHQQRENPKSKLQPRVIRSLTVQKERYITRENSFSQNETGIQLDIPQKDNPILIKPLFQIHISELKQYPENPNLSELSIQNTPNVSQILNIFPIPAPSISTCTQDQIIQPSKAPIMKSFSASQLLRLQNQKLEQKIVKSPLDVSNSPSSGKIKIKTITKSTININPCHQRSSTLQSPRDRQQKYNISYHTTFLNKNKSSPTNQQQISISTNNNLIPSPQNGSSLSTSSRTTHPKSQNFFLPPPPSTSVSLSSSTSLIQNLQTKGTQKQQVMKKMPSSSLHNVQQKYKSHFVKKIEVGDSFNLKQFISSPQNSSPKKEITFFQFKQIKLAQQRSNSSYHSLRQKSKNK